MKEERSWELCWIIPGGSIQTKKVVGGYSRACQEARNLRFKMRKTEGVRIWIMSEF